jgi:hypothetical protein
MVFETAPCSLRAAGDPRRVGWSVSWPALRTFGPAGRSPKVARKSARIAHELPSSELTSCAPEAKSLLMHTIFRVE